MIGPEHHVTTIHSQQDVLATRSAGALLPEDHVTNSYSCHEHCKGSSLINICRQCTLVMRTCTPVMHMCTRVQQESTHTQDALRPAGVLPQRVTLG
jgi:hypothetical protein